GHFAYVANFSGSVSVINTQTNEVVKLANGKGAIDVGGEPWEIAITPHGHFAYVGNSGDTSPSVINTQTNEVVKIGGQDAIKVGNGPVGIATTPDHPPVAGFAAATRARPGVPLTLDASSSKDPDSSIASYAWSFGDGQSQSLTSAKTTH